jgi:hypothetical protein
MVTLLQNIFLEKALQPPFLVTAVLQNFLQHNLVVWSLQCNATHSTSHTTCYDNVKHSGNHVIMLYKPYLCRLREEIRSKGFSLVLAACIGNSNIKL